MPAKLTGEGQDFINNNQLPLFWRNHSFTKTAIVSERPQFFFEINESWYSCLIYRLCIAGKNQKSKSQG